MNRYNMRHMRRMSIRTAACALTLILAFSIPAVTFSALGEDNGGSPPDAFEEVFITDNDLQDEENHHISDESEAENPDENANGGGDSGTGGDAENSDEDANEGEDSGTDGDAENSDEDVNEGGDSGTDGNTENSDEDTDEGGDSGTDGDAENPDEDANGGGDSGTESGAELPEFEGQESPEQPPETNAEDPETDTESIELSDNFSQFVNAVSLNGAGGGELPTPANMKITDPVTLRLNADFSTQVLTAIREQGDAEYTVHIPDKLAAKAGSYEIKALDKLLGTLHADEQGAYFVFNTAEDSIFGGDEPDELNNVKLDIECVLDETSIGGVMEFGIDLSEYEQGKAYTIRIVKALSVGARALPLPITDDFGQFVKSVRLVENADSINAADLPSPYLMGSVDTIYMLFELKDLEGSDLMAILANGPDFEYKIAIPDMLKGVDIEQNFDVVIDSNGNKSTLGTLHISGGEAYFTFNTTEEDFFDGETAIIRNLWLSFECGLDKIDPEDRGVTVNMGPYDAGKNYEISFKDRIPANPAMYKSGAYDESTGLYNWTVTILAPETGIDERDYLTGPFTDSTGTNHALVGDVKITGKRLGDAEANTTAFTEGNGLTITTEGEKPDGFVVTVTDGATKPYVGTVTIKYSTVLTGDAFLNDAAVNELTNNSTFKYGDTPEKLLEADAAVSNVNTALTQKDGVFIPADREIEWTVVVDTLGQGFSKLILHDNMQIPYTYRQNSVTVNGTNVLAEGKPVTFTGSTMVLPLIAEGGDNQYGNARIFTIKYRTPIGSEEDYIGNVASGDPIENDAWLEFSWDGGPGYGPGDNTQYEPPTVGKGTDTASTPILKDAVSYNAANRTITWKITVNPNRLNLVARDGETGIKVTDIIDDSQEHNNLRYVSDSLRIGGGVANPVSVTGAGSKELTLYLPDLDKVEATFLVTSVVTDNVFLGSNEQKAAVFANDAELEATAVIVKENPEDTIKKDVSGSASATISPDNNILRKTAGNYDYNMHIMDWTIYVNADKITPFSGSSGNGVIITDTVPEGQEFVADSITVSGVTPASGPTIAGDKKSFTVDLGDLSGDTNGKSATITYQTKFTSVKEDTAISFENTAKMTSQYGDTTVKETKPIDDLVVLEKLPSSIIKPEPSTALVTYRILINQSQEAFPAFTLTDTIAKPAGAIVNVDLSTVVLRKATIDPAKGGFTAAGGNLLPAPGAAGAARFDGDKTMTVPVDAGSGALVLEYDVIVRVPGGTISGKMNNSISSTHLGAGNAITDESTADFGKASASGGNLEKYLNVDIVKKDEKTGGAVSGVELGLYFNTTGGTNDSDYTLIAQSKTNSSGHILFNLLMPSNVTANHYYIKELPTSGYTGKITFIGKDENKTYSSGEYIPVTDVAEGTDRTFFFTLTNERTDHAISFYKVAEQGASRAYAPVGGATFALTADSEGYYGLSGSGKPAFPTVTENPANSGTFTIANLKWGIYTLEEKSPPSGGYVPYNATYTLTVARPATVNGDPTVTITKNTGTSPLPAVTNYSGKPAIVNEKGSITITKMDENNTTPIKNEGALTGATLELYQKTGNSGTDDADYTRIGTPRVTGTDTSLTDPNKNMLKFYDLEYGETYRIKETVAPTGYELNAINTPIWVTDDFTIGAAAGTVHRSQTVTNNRKGAYSFSFYKYKKTYATPDKVPAGSGEATFELYKTSDGSLGNVIATATTGPDGKVTFTGIPFDNYYIVETAPPGKYSLPKVEKAMMVVLTRSAEGEVTPTITDLTNNSALISGTTNPFINYKGSFTITKKDNLYTSTPNVNLNGARFAVDPPRENMTLTPFTVDGTTYPDTVEITGSTGKVTIDGLNVDTEYTFTEITAPTGYTVNSTPLTFKPEKDKLKGSAQVDGGKDFTNNRTPNHSFSFTKVGEDGVTTIPGATFSIVLNATAGAILPLPSFPSVTTAASGVVTFTNLPYGSYTITETTPPDGYRFGTSTKSFTLNIAPNGDKSLKVDGVDVSASDYKFTNYLGKFTVIKKDAVNGDLISGVEFELTKTSDGSVIAADETGMNGQYTFTGLFIGDSYTVTEKSTVEGYVLNTTPYTFTLTDAANTAGSPGSPSADSAATGWHQWKTITNARKTYSFGFIKKDNYNNPLGGAEFGLYTTANVKITGFDSGGKPTTGSGTHVTVKSGTDGTVKFTALPFGVYHVKEESAPTLTPAEGLHSYNKSDVVLEVEIEKDGSYTVTDTAVSTNTASANIDAISGLIVKNELLGSLKITKTDEIGGAALENAGFTLYKNGTQVGIEQTTDADGIVIFKGLTLGQLYVVEETTVPSGYDKAADLEVTPVYDSDDPTLYNMVRSVVNDRSGDHYFSLSKVDSFGDPVVGAKFGIYRDLQFADPVQDGSNNKTATSTATGEVKFENLKPNTYYVKELEAPERYAISDAVLKVFIAIDEQNMDNAVITDASTGAALTEVINKNTGSLIITKRDAIDNSILISGATFSLYKGINTSGQKIASKATGADGICKFDDLILNESYFVKEDSVNSAYNTPTWSETVVIRQSDLVAGSGNHYEVTKDVYNGRATVYSFGFKKQDDHGNNLGGAEFGLYTSVAEDEITGFDSDGSPTTGSGTHVTVKSGADGTVKFTGIPFGVYRAKEISGPTRGGNSYKMSAVVLEIAIDADGKYTVTDTADPTSVKNANKGAISGFIVKNELLGSITVIKQNKFAQKLAGVEFTLLDSNQQPVLGPFKTNSNGVVVFSGLTLGQIYTVTETASLPYYTTHAGVDVKPAYPQHNVTLTVTNEREKPYSFDFLKRDSFGNSLEGAKFGVLQVADSTDFASVGSDFTPEKTIVSGSDGKVRFENLSFGRYYIREITPPAGYDKTDTVLCADIAPGGSLSITKVSGSDVTNSAGKVVVINNRATTYSFSFDKLAENTGNGLAGAVFSVMPTADDDGNTVTLPPATANTATSDSLGKVTFSGLPFGAYLVEEVSAPTNYTKCEGRFKVDIDIGGNVMFSEDIGDSLIEIAADGRSASVKNNYNSSTTGKIPGNVGGGSGRGGGSGSGNNGISAPSATSPASAPPSLPSFFPPDTTSTEPEIVKQTDDYTITIQTATTPQGEDYDIATITVTEAGGASVGEIPPPAPRDGQEFGGWYLDPEMTIPYRPGDPLPPGTTRLYAKWYLSAKDWGDNNNPSTGDNAHSHRAITAAIIFAFTAIILAVFHRKSART